MANHKIVWVRCYGLPLPLWNEDCFAKVLGEMASLVSVGTSTLLWENLEYVRLQVRLKNRSNVRLAKRLRINDQLWNVLIEEEPPACYEGRHTESRYGPDSTDSMSSSETYVEEMVSSPKSCEEEVRSVFREDLRSKGEEEGGKVVEGGEQNAHKTNFFFKVSSSKSNTNQRKVCTPYTNEESIGQEACQGVDLDVNPDQGRTLLCNNYFAHAELAKVVVGIESNNSQCEAVHILDQERNVEAHCHVDRIPRVTQSGKTDLGLGTSPEFPRCENVYGNTNLGSLRGGKQVSVRRIELL